MKTIRQPKLHSPPLLNATEICADKLESGTTFNMPTFQDVRELSMNDFVKVAFPGPVVPEFMWLEVCGACKFHMSGVVRSEVDQPDIQTGDLIHFCPDNIFQVKRKGAI